METPVDLAEVLTIREISLDELDEILYMNQKIFKEDRLINRFDHPYLLLLVAEYQGLPVGFKVGYGLADGITFYSAKGGVMKSFRNRGIAKKLMLYMMERVKELGYNAFTYDTFPVHFPGMFQMGLLFGFTVSKNEYNAEYQDWRHHMRMDLSTCNFADLRTLIEKPIPK